MKIIKNNLFIILILLPMIVIAENNINIKTNTCDINGDGINEKLIIKNNININHRNELFKYKHLVLLIKKIKNTFIILDCWNNTTKFPNMLDAIAKDLNNDGKDEILIMYAYAGASHAYTLVKIFSYYKDYSILNYGKIQIVDDGIDALKYQPHKSNGFPDIKVHDDLYQFDGIRYKKKRN